MARPRKNQISWVDTAAYTGSAARELPKSPRLLKSIIRALLKRISLVDEDESRQIYSEIRFLVAAEEGWDNCRPTYHQVNYPKMNIDDFFRYYGRHLREIAIGKKTKSNHRMETLILQGAYLKTYLISHEYPVGDDFNQNNCLVWLGKHGGQIDGILTAFDCFCGYPCSVMEFVGHLGKANCGKKPSLDFLSSLEKTRNKILAGLHSCEEKTIVQKLKTGKADALAIGRERTHPINAFNCLTPPFLDPF